MSKTNKERLQDNNTALLRIKTKAQDLPDFGGDVKLFETVNEMQADENPQEGDLAVVYREEIQPITEESEFDSCVFPNTVVLDEAFTGGIYGSFRAVDGSSSYFDGMVDMSSSRFRFSGLGESVDISISYTSSDGITYTRTDGGEELQEFGTTIQWDDGMGSFNSVIGNFMKLGGNYFEGLYTYTYNKTEDFIKMDVYNFNIENNTLYVPYLNQRVSNSDINTAEEDLLNIENNLKGYTVTTDGTYLYFYFSNYGSIRDIYLDITSNNSFLPSIDMSENPIDISNVKEYRYNISTQTLEQVSFTPVHIGYGSGNSAIQLQNNEYPIYICWFNDNNERNLLSIRYFVFNNISTDTSRIITNNDLHLNPEHYYAYYYTISKSQLNTTSDYVYEKTFYGKNGVENGILTANVSNSFVDVNAEIMYKLQIAYNNMTPRILTDNDKSIDTKLYFIPTKFDGTPLLDTSHVTDMSYMFQSCSNLITVPLLDTSNATSMYSMFSGCSNLITVPLLDTSNATNMGNMFNGCTSLTTISLLDTSSVTNISSMFKNCSSLTAIPQLNMSNATNAESLFNYCSSLTTVPSLDVSKATNASNMFSYCTNLTTISSLNLSSATDVRQMFRGCSSLTAIQSLNTANVVDTSYMFNDCTSLTTVPLLNISNATSVYGMFQGCTSLTSVPQLDTSNVISMYSMFQDCTSLTSIPQLDTSKVQLIYCMFQGCTSLTSVPQLNMSAAKGTRNMFDGCTNLITVPQFNLSNVTTNMSSMFKNCPNLSNDSLNNILATCTGATKITSNKTLKYIGLSQEQATTCQSLSNYQAFINAGWITGY